MTGAAKNDKKDIKPAMEFVHPDTWLGVGNAMRAGEIKYGDWNFLKGHGRLQLCGAILRHTAAIMRGEDVDADTSALLGKTVYHWDCIGANINMMVWQMEYNTLIEDRPPIVPEHPAVEIQRKLDNIDHPDGYKISPSEILDIYNIGGN